MRDVALLLSNRSITGTDSVWTNGLLGGYSGVHVWESGNPTTALKSNGIMCVALKDSDIDFMVILLGIDLALIT